MSELMNQHLLAIETAGNRLHEAAVQACGERDEALAKLAECEAERDVLKAANASLFRDLEMYRGHKPAFELAHGLAVLKERAEKAELELARTIEAMGRMNCSEIATTGRANRPEANFRAAEARAESAEARVRELEARAGDVESLGRVLFAIGEDGLGRTWDEVGYIAEQYKTEARAAIAHLFGTAPAKPSAQEAIADALGSPNCLDEGGDLVMAFGGTKAVVLERYVNAQLRACGVLK